MERRTLLKSVLALPAIAPAISCASDLGTAWNALYTGLPGLDYALGGIRRGQLGCVVGPACMGKTLLLVELAARISRRYGGNVLFYSVQKPSVYLAKKLSLRGDAKVVFAEESLGEVGMPTETPALHLLDSTAADLSRAFALARQLQHAHASGCALAILDGFHTCAPRVMRDNSGSGKLAFLAERWPHQVLSNEILIQAQQFAEATSVPILMGVTTASLVDCEAIVESSPLESEIRIRTDRLLTLHRPTIYKETAALRQEEKNLVRLTGTCPEWWDTRCSTLRFNARPLAFETVV